MIVTWPDWWFGEDHILAAGELSLEPGVLLISGTSGIGKTTLVRNIVSNNPNLSSILVFQEPTLLPWLTLAENLRLVSEELLDIISWLDIFGLANCQSLRPGQMSLGMQRRAAIVRGLLKKPSLLMLDEPSASLDQENIDRLLSCLNRLQKLKPISIMIVSHQEEHFSPLNPKKLTLMGTPAILTKTDASQ